MLAFICELCWELFSALKLYLQENLETVDQLAVLFLY